MVLLDRLPCFGTYQGTVLALALSHFSHVVAFILDHSFGSECAGWRFAFDFDQMA